MERSQELRASAAIPAAGRPESQWETRAPIPPSFELRFL